LAGSTAGWEGWGDPFSAAISEEGRKRTVKMRIIRRFGIESVLYECACLSSLTDPIFIEYSKVASTYLQGEEYGFSKDQSR